MKKIHIGLSIVLPLIILAACTENPDIRKSEAADLILSNGKIYTVDSNRNWASAVAIKDGVLQFVGSDDEAFQYKGDETKVVNLDNKMVLPSFQDVHTHPILGGLAYTACALFGLDSLDKVLAKVSKCMKDNPGEKVLQGNGWDWGIFIGGQGPSKEILDAIDNTRPIVLGDGDGHTLWLNSPALVLAGIDRNSKSPDGGEIGFGDDGEPSGVLREGPAMALIQNKLDKPSFKQKKAALLYAQEYFNGLGITAIQDANVGVGKGSSNRTLPVYQSLLDKEQLNLRVVAAMYWEPNKGMGQIEDMKAAREKYSNGRLKVSSIKFWADGIIETHTAKLLQPYTDKPDTDGLLMVPKKEIMAAVPALDAEGFQVHIHAIGDATVRYALDAIETAQQRNGKRDSRHLTAHTQLVNPSDISRFAELNTIATFSPYWAYYDEYVKTINPPQLGEQRMRQMYPMRDIIDSGAKIAFGSDWSVSTADPLLGIETAVTRKDPEAESELVFTPEQRISLDEAISAYTINAAYTNFLDEETGSIEVGKYADLVVLDKNLFEMAPQNISDAKVEATLLEGKLIFGKLEGLK